MKLLKFNLIFIPTLGICFALVAFAAHNYLLDDARQHVVQNARIIMETALSSRTYTVKQVAPLLQQKNFKLQTAITGFRKTIEEMPKTVDPNAAKDIRGSAKKGFLLGQQRFVNAQQQFLESVGKPEDLLDTEFHPQTVPAFAATEIFTYLREKFPDFFYKEATLNPSNPRNRATDWETDVVNRFRSGAGQGEFVSTRQTPSGDSLFLARPIKVNNVSCLQCHSTPENAPPEMIKLYGTANGFGWKMDEIIGAQIVSVPMSVPVQMAESTFRRLLGCLGGAFGGIFLVGNAAVALLTREKSKPAVV